MSTVQRLSSPSQHNPSVVSTSVVSIDQLATSPVNRSSALAQERVLSSEISQEPREQPKKIFEESKYDLSELEVAGSSSMHTMDVQNPEQD